MSKLKPCPFCGSKTLRIDHCFTYMRHVECMNRNCATLGPIKNTERKAVLAWNKAPRKEEARR